MKKLVMSRKSLMLIAALVALAVMLTLGGCAQEGSEGGNTGLTDDPAVYWNTDMGADRTANADGTYTIKVAKDGVAVDLVVADKATLDAIDKLQVFGISTNASGAAAAVKTVEELGYTKTAWENYVQMIGGKMVKLNAAETLDGEEVTIEVLKTTGVYDMSGCSEFVGAATKLQSLDQVMVLKKGEEYTHVFVSGRDGIINTVTKMCEACGKEVEWTNWFYDNILPDTGGHYFLEKDVTLTANTVAKAGVLCLDLNGKTVKQTTEGQNVYSVGLDMNLMDTVGTGKILPSNWPMANFVSDAKSGRSFGQGFQISAGATLNIYGGTIDATGVTAQYGVCINNNGNLNIYGGKIIGGESWGSGSAAICNQGPMTMSGGEIIGGYAKNGKFGKDTKGGGAMRISPAGSFVMTGGSITGGKADNHGGVLNVAGQCYIKGGTISGGTAGLGGDNIWVYKSGKLTLDPSVKIDGIGYE